jgi:pimeloyl-ACP methyl ester carboxylesterase
MIESLQLHVHNQGLAPTLIYLPGMHGDCTLLAGFRQALAGRACLAEFTYPRCEDWAVNDYARKVAALLMGRGLTRGWLLGESFSSQVAWALIGQTQKTDLTRSSRATDSTAAPFAPEGLILAGGFVRHPLPFAVALGGQVSRHIPTRLLRRLCEVWASSAARRSKECPETLAGLREFVERRTNELDRRAITRRYGLLLETDSRPVARRAGLPVFLLAGRNDPVVPWPWVRAWLCRHCPGFRDSRVIPRAGHAVLLDAPKESADQILRWITP